jgi:hypothetical protein
MGPPDTRQAAWALSHQLHFGPLCIFSFWQERTLRRRGGGALPARRVDRGPWTFLALCCQSASCPRRVRDSEIRRSCPPGWNAEYAPILPVSLYMVRYQQGRRQQGATACQTTQQRSGRKNSAGRKKPGSGKTLLNVCTAALLLLLAQRCAMRAIKGSFGP